MAAFFNKVFEGLADESNECRDLLPAQFSDALVTLLRLTEDEALKAVTIYLREQKEDDFEWSKFVTYLVERGHKEAHVRHCLFAVAFTFLIEGTDIEKIAPTVTDAQLKIAMHKMAFGIPEQELAFLVDYFLKDGGTKVRKDIETEKICKFFTGELVMESSKKVLLPGSFFLITNGAGLMACKRIILDADSVRHVARRNIRKHIDHVVKRWRWDSISHFRASDDHLLFIDGDMLYLMGTPPAKKEPTKTGYNMESDQKEALTACAIRTEYREWIGEENSNPEEVDEELTSQSDRVTKERALDAYIDEHAGQPFVELEEKLSQLSSAPDDDGGHAESDVPEMDATQVVAGLKVLFTRYAPKLLSAIPKLMEEHKGHEAETFNKLRKEYGESYFKKGVVIFPQMKTDAASTEITLMYDEYEPIKKRKKLKDNLPDLLKEHECKEWQLVNKCREKYCESFVSEETGELNSNMAGFAKLVFNSAIENDGEFDPAILRMKPFDPVAGMADDAITAVQITKAEGKPVVYTIEVHLNNGEIPLLTKQAKDFERFYKKKLPVADRAILKDKLCDPPALGKDAIKNKLALNRWFFKIFQMVSNKVISVDAKLALDAFLAVSFAFL
jgi:hypothetical protein